jgi:pilus assembly protein CpaB
MKNIRAIVILLVAIAAGIAAVALANNWLAERARDVAAVKVVVAARDIELGTQFLPQMLELVDWPRQSVPPGSFNNIEELLEKPGQSPARVLRFSLQKGEPVLESKLASAGAKAGLAAIVADGKRAMTVSVNEIVGVAGFALPGNYVDILLNTQDENAKRNDQRISKIVLEHVLVLAIAQTAKRDETAPRVVSAVTLELTPEEAEKIDLARSVGTLTLVLRNQMDVAPADTAGARKPGLFGDSATELKAQTAAAATPPPATPPATPPVRRSKPVVTQPAGERVEIIRGVNRSVENFGGATAK